MDLKEWIEWSQLFSKYHQKSKEATKFLNDFIIKNRERERYFEEKGYFPEEFDWPEWKQGIERSRYVKKLTETNETSTAKRPSRAKIKPPVSKAPWRPPPH